MNRTCLDVHKEHTDSLHKRERERETVKPFCPKLDNSPPLWATSGSGKMHLLIAVCNKKKVKRWRFMRYKWAVGLTAPTGPAQSLKESVVAHQANCNTRYVTPNRTSLRWQMAPHDELRRSSCSLLLFHLLHLRTSTLTMLLNCQVDPELGNVCLSVAVCRRYVCAAVHWVLGSAWQWLTLHSVHTHTAEQCRAHNVERSTFGTSPKKREDAQ